jgi:hypothetical protein
VKLFTSYIGASVAGKKIMRYKVNEFDYPSMVGYWKLDEITNNYVINAVSPTTKIPLGLGTLNSPSWTTYMDMLVICEGELEYSTRGECSYQKHKIA